MKKVIVTCKLPGSSLTWLAKQCDLYVYGNGERTMPDVELQKAIGECDGVITLLSNNITTELLAKAPLLKVVSNYAVGYNNIDVEACTERGIWVCNTPGVLTETTADCAWALIMATARRIVEADRFIRSGSFNGWAPGLLMGADVYGKTLGIIGMGRIGQAVARRASGFNMKVVFYDDFAKEIDYSDAEAVSFNELLTVSDYISLHVPYAPDTHHLIDDVALSKMKPTAILINTARGPIVNEMALVKALKNGTIAGAGLDVFENEPTVNAGLLDLDNVVLLPHIASSTVATRQRMAELAVHNLWKVLNGELPLHAVNNIESEAK